MQRRSFLKTSSLAVISGSSSPLTIEANPGETIRPTLVLNAYSFNNYLRSGKVSIQEVLRFCAEVGLKGVDLTAYYIPGYPEVPDDNVLHDIKNSAFLLGMSITGTGVRNDFTLKDPGKRALEVKLVKNWVVAAAKMGAPHVRVFAGRQSPPGYTREEIKSWMIEDFKECADFGARYGVMIAFQNHNDFIVSAEDTIDILDRVDSDWFGLMLDIGSLPYPDPYAEIEKLIHYAITWQVKENVKTGSVSIPTDFHRLMKIVYEHEYIGYFPLETLGEGDPFNKVSVLYRRITDSMKKYGP